MLCDLHTHSLYSDGSFSPAELIASAKAQNLTIALTDHNTAAGLPEFMAEAKKQGVTAVAGVELSTVWEGKELHLLGLFLPPESYSELNQLMQAFHILKEQSNIDLIQRLNDAGYAIDYPSVKKRNLTGSINRAHIAAELLEKGYVSSVRDAFNRLLGEDCGFYVPPTRLGMLDAIRFLRKVRAIPVLAHPLQELDAQQLRRLLPEAVDAGLIGLEVIHSNFSPEKQALAAEIAAEFGLLPSGGSDFHGTVKPDVRLAFGKGNMEVPVAYYHNLLAKHRTL